MMLTRHTQVENLANLLGARRQNAVARARRDEAYRELVATILGVPVEAVAARPLPTLARPTLISRDAAHTRAA